MAALTRLTWLTMKTEVQRRLAREGDTATASRIEYWIDAAYRLIGLTWHHHELDETSPDVALAAGADSVAFPADGYLPLGVRIKSSAGTIHGRLTPDRASYLLSKGPKLASRPKSYARLGDELYFDATANADYLLDIFYYKEPPAADFVSDGSPLDRVFDELIMQGAVSIGMNGFWMPDLASVQRETMTEYLARLGHPVLGSGTVTDPEEDAGPHGGALG